MTLELIDSHCHLGFPALAAELESVLERARARGVAAVVDVGIDVATSRAAVERSEARRGVHATAGLHPNDCAALASDWPELSTIAASPGVVAIGETGLDLYWKKVPLGVQIESLERHMALARRLGKPLILHCRDAFPELLSALAPHAPVHGVLHCFTGGEREAAACLDLGLFVSFAGPVTYPRNDELRRAAKAVPEDRLLVETDSPFLPPQSQRGKRNEPGFVAEVAAAVAAARATSPERVAASTARNARHLFGLGPASDGGLGSEAGS